MSKIMLLRDMLKSINATEINGAKKIATSKVSQRHFEVPSA
jgi:hypothetical protein